MHKKKLILPLVFLFIFLSLTYIVSAVVTLRETFENGTVLAWGGGNANLTNPINGSYSYGGAEDGNYYKRSIGMTTNNSFNVSFRFRHQSIGGGCMRFGLTDNEASTPEAHSIGFAMGLSNECATLGDDSRLWVGTQNGLIDSGRTCLSTTETSGICNITIEINRTDSGSTADTVWRFYLNDYVNSTWYNTTGTMPVRKADSFFARTGLGNMLKLDDIRVWNGTEAPVSLTVILNSPVNNTYNTSLLRVNVTVSNTDGINFTNVSLVVNGTTNATSLSVPNNANFPINMTSITDGNYDWYIRACVNTGDCINSGTRIYHFDNTSPTITLINPISAGNISIFNLTTNITVQSSTLNYSNFTVYNPDGTRLYTLTLTTANDADNVYFNTVVNFTTDGNYTINISSRDNAGLETNTSTWYYFDKIAPNITIASPTFQQIVTTQTPTLSFLFTDKTANLVNCQYWVVRNSSGTSFEVPVTSFNCNSNTFINLTSGGLTGGLEYTLHVNATDGQNSNETIRNFNVSVGAGAGGGGGSGGGGGGGGGSGTAVALPVCAITIVPSIISIGIGKTTEKIILSNNEDSTFTPTFAFKDIDGKNSYKDQLSLTNIPPTISQNGFAEFGIKYNGKSDVGGYNQLVISSLNCADIVVPININVGAVSQIVGQLLDPNKTIKENLIDISLSSVSAFIPFFQIWMLMSLILIITLLITFERISQLNKKGKKLSVISIIIFDFVFSIIISTIIAGLLP